MAFAVFSIILALGCHNEIISSVLLLIAGVWGVFKLFDEMDKGGYR